MNWLKRVWGVVWSQCDLENLMLVLGVGLLARGMYLWWPPGAWIVIGCILLAIWVILIVASVMSQRGNDGNR